MENAKIVERHGREFRIIRTDDEIHVAPLEKVLWRRVDAAINKEICYVVKPGDDGKWIFAPRGYSAFHRYDTFEGVIDAVLESIAHILGIYDEEDEEHARKVEYQTNMLDGAWAQLEGTR